MKQKVWGGALLLLILVGCTTTDPVRAPEERGPEPVATPVPSPDPSPSSRVVQSLAEQAYGQYLQGDYAGAIATAERGLGIDRRAGELYLLIAQSYWQLSRLREADQFAAQGQRYAPEGSDLARLLVALRQALAEEAGLVRF